jgi:thioredoxin
MRAEEEGVDEEEEDEDEVVAVAVAHFELGAGRPLMDRSSPQMVDEVPGVEASRGGGGGGVVLILGNMLYLLPYPARAPPLRQIRSTNEFDRLMNKHATSTGLPVIVDFYSDGCGPCRMIAPVFKKLASEMEGKAVFVKVDTNAMYELSSRYSVRSLPTFKFFLGGKKVHEFSGAGEGQLRQFAQQIIQKAEFENVLL